MRVVAFAQDFFVLGVKQSWGFKPSAAACLVPKYWPSIRPGEAKDSSLGHTKRALGLCVGPGWLNLVPRALFPGSTLYQRLFLARFRPSANTENSCRTREKPLLPRVLFYWACGREVNNH